WCALPDLKVPAIKVRVDSGAKTSALHAEQITPFEKNGETWIKFLIHPIQKNVKSAILCEAKVIDRRIVTSSTGTRESRYVINTELSLVEKSWTIELTLTNRDSMGFRMLLGREAMTRNIIVDPDEHFKFGIVTPEKIKEYYSPTTQENKGLRIGVLASNPDLYSNQRIIEAGELRGHEMHI